MRRSTLRTIRGAAFVLLLAATFASVLTSGPSTRAAQPQKSHAQASKLEGTWLVQITLRNCQTGEALGNPFPSLVTFARGGTVTATTARTSPALLSPFYGVWRHTGDHTYSSVAQAFLFSPAGVWTGTQTLRQAIEFGDNPDEYHVTATIEIADPGGNVISTGCATAVGRRLE